MVESGSAGDVCLVRKVSHVVASTSSGIPVATLLILFAFFLLGVVGGHPLWGALCGVPFAITYNIWAWEKAEMLPIFHEVSASAQRVGWLVELLTVLGILAA